MGDKKQKNFNKDDKKTRPTTAANDQLGENSGDGRLMKDTVRNGKNR